MMQRSHAADSSPSSSSSSCPSHSNAHSSSSPPPPPPPSSSFSSSTAHLHRSSDVAPATSCEASSEVLLPSTSFSSTCSTVISLHRHSNASSSSSSSSSSATDFYAPQVASAGTRFHSSNAASSTAIAELQYATSNVDSFTAISDSYNPTSSASFPCITDVFDPSFHKDLRASQCAGRAEPATLSSNNFQNPDVSTRNHGYGFSPSSSADYGSSVTGRTGLPWRPSFKATRELLKRPPATAIKMTYMSVKEKVDPEAHADNHLAMIILQSSQRMNRRASVSSPSSSNRKPVVRSHDRKWVYEASTVTHEDELKDIIRNLENWKKKWENDGNYLQAAAVAKQLQALKIFLENKRRITMLNAHCNEKEDAESAYKAEINEKNKLWKERFKVFQDEVIQHAQLLKQHHAIALQSFKHKMDARTPKQPQRSRDLLNERKVQTCLGKQGKYLEAQTVKSHADHKELKELQATLDAYQSEVTLKERVLKAKQQSEMSILLQRAAQTRDELRKNKENDISCCIQRHKRILEDLEVLHKLERLKSEQKMKKIIREFRAVGGEMKDLSYAMEKLVIPVVTAESGVEAFASSSKLEIDALNI